MMTHFLLCVAILSGDAEIEKACVPVYASYEASLAYLIAHEEEFDDIVTYDNVIQVEYHVDVDPD